MASFTTRVELHDATWNDYTALHGEMKKKGFLLTITANDGKVYHLPPAEYDFIGNVTANDVCEKAKAAARTIKTSFAVLVSEAPTRVWSGLKLA